GSVFFERSAKSRAGLNPRIGGIRNRAERVHRLKVTVANISESRAVKSVGPGAGNDVYHAARGASIFCGITVGDDLEFLHGLLRHRRANAVHGIVDRIGAIDIYQIGASPLSAHVQPGGGSSPDRGRVIAGKPRIREGEIDDVATV